MSMTYSNIKTKMWSSRNGTYRNILRTYGDSTAIVASYLMTSPHARQSGVFSCPIHYIATETERTVEEVEQCLQNLEEIRFCKYDYEEEVVWVLTMPNYQVSPKWTELRKEGVRQDKRYQGIINSLEDVSHSYLCAEFCDFWSLPSGAISGLLASTTTAPVQTVQKDPLQGASKGLGKGLQNDYGNGAS